MALARSVYTKGKYSGWVGFFYRGAINLLLRYSPFR